MVSIAGWMLDPVACAGMTIGPPRVDLAALVELQRLLMRTANPAHSRSDVGIVREEGNEASQVAGTGAGPADEPAVRHQQTGRAGLAERDKVIIGAGSDPVQAAGLRVEERDDDQR